MARSHLDKAAAERKKYVDAFNNTMVQIWREKINLLGIVDTGNLYRSVEGTLKVVDDSALSAQLGQMFATYGLYVDAGTGKEVYRGNPGDIGRDKVRVARQWFSKKYFASVMNIRDFFADSIGQEFTGVVAEALGGGTPGSTPFNF